jgi:hypothetical protein
VSNWPMLTSNRARGAACFFSGLKLIDSLAAGELVDFVLGPMSVQKLRNLSHHPAYNAAQS